MGADVYWAAYSERRSSTFVRSMAHLIWTGPILINRCNDPNSRNLDRRVTSRSPRKQFEAEKKALLRGSFFTNNLLIIVSS